MIKAFAFYTAIFICLSAPANAKDYEEFHIGGFALGPKLEISQEYNDNILANEHNEKSDFITSIRPSIEIKKSIRDHNFKFKAGAQIDHFAKYSSENIENYHAKFDGRLIAKRAWQIPFEISYETLHRERGEDRSNSNTTAPIEYTRFKTMTGLDYNPRGNFSASLQLVHAQERFDNGRDNAGNIVVRDDEDKDTLGADLRLQYKAMPSLKPFIGLSIERENYLNNEFSGSGYNGRNPDNSTHSALIGTKFEAGRMIDGQIAIGASHQKNDQPGEDDINALTVSARINWRPTKRLNINTSYLRDIDEDPSIASRVIRNDFMAGAEYLISPDLTLSLGGLYSLDKFEDRNRRDNIYALSTALDYAINRNIDIGAELRHKTRNSNQQGQSFDQNSVMLRMKSKL